MFLHIHFITHSLLTQHSSGPVSCPETILSSPAMINTASFMNTCSKCRVLL